MNLDQSPTKEQLRKLIASCNDRAANHVLWVDEHGQVHIDPSPEDGDGLGFQQDHPSLRLRYETFLKGNEYVGPAAANDEEWVSQLLETLLKGWQKAKAGKETKFLLIG